MSTPISKRPARSCALATVLVASLFSTHAEANCFGPRQNEVVCGDKRICVSGQPAAAEGFYDRNTCVWQKGGPVCKTLSHLADVYVGGSKSERPAGKQLIEIASAERLASVSPAICKKLGIPTSMAGAPAGTPRPPGGTWCRSNAQRGGAPGSTHKFCLAMDILVPGVPHGASTRAQRQKLANELYKGQQRGINVYASGRAHVANSREFFYSSDVRPLSGPPKQTRSRRTSR